MRMLCLTLLLISTCAAQEFQVVIIWPRDIIVQPRPKTQTKPQDDIKLQTLIRLAKEKRQKEEEISRMFFLEMIAKQPPVDPHKDEFWKYKEKQRLIKVAEEYPELQGLVQKPRNDFEEWKRNQPIKKKKPEKEPEITEEDLTRIFNEPLFETRERPSTNQEPILEDEEE